MGETPEVAAAKRIKEETGLDIVRIEDKLYDSYSAIGFSNETNAVIIGVAKGEFTPSTSTVEEIEAKWYTRDEIKELLKDKHFAARTQAYCYMWSKGDKVKSNKIHYILMIMCSAIILCFTGCAKEYHSIYSV